MDKHFSQTKQYILNRTTHLPLIFSLNFYINWATRFPRNMILTEREKDYKTSS